MFRTRLGHLSLCLSAAALCLFPAAKVAVADSIPVSFSGTVGNCSSSDATLCSSVPSSAAVTGSYSVVPGTLPAQLPFITGSWEFSTPFGVISSTMSGASANLITPYPFSTVPPNPLGNFPVVQFSADDIFLQLTFNSMMESFSEFGYGQLVTSETTPSSGTFFPSTLAFDSPSGSMATMDFTAGAAVPTPEPSSLLLFGTAMSAIFLCVRGRRTKGEARN